MLPSPPAAMESLGKYEIIEKIGEGGFGAVFKARDPHLKRIVALKTCTHDDADLQKRFLREGEIVASLQHPNITLIHDLGFEGGTPFLVQEFLTGEDLSAVISRRDRLDDETRFGWLIGVARGLEYAHAQGIIHRDIKPANIRILADGTPKIMDFGIAKLTQDENRLTRTGSAMGTIAYMSPEQLDGSQVDHRSDIFAFGVLAYELFAYSRPFDGETTSRIVYQILHEDPRRIESMAPPFGPGLNQILRRCLAKKPLMRFQSCGEAATAFERLRLGLAPFFTMRKARSHKDLVGRTCTVTTGTVDARFGQAQVNDGGAGLLLHVRHDGGGAQDDGQPHGQRSRPGPRSRALPVRGRRPAQDRRRRAPAPRTVGRARTARTRTAPPQLIALEARFPSGGAALGTAPALRPPLQDPGNPLGFDRGRSRAGPDHPRNPKEAG